jgi:transposase
LHGGAIRTTQVIAFLGQLRRFFPGKLLLIWDRAQIHRSRRVLRHLEIHRDRLAMTYLPAYAPELNPVEYLWGYWKQHELANFCSKDIWHLGHFASQALKGIRRRPNRSQLITAFWHQAELF